MKTVFLRTVMCAGLLGALPWSIHAQPVGRVLAVAGSASIDRGGQSLPIQHGADIQNGDTIAVGERSALQVRFADESVVALRANSQIKIEDFRYTRNVESDRSIMALLKGGLRTITGLIGKNNAKAYGIQTSTATVGIRGTHFTLVACANDCTNPDGTAVPNGLFGGVTDGRISVSNNAGESEFEQQENFYLADINAVPERLLTPPGILIDRALVARARSANASDASATVDAKTESRASDQVSNSPKLTLLRMLASDPVALRALAATGQYPGLVDFMTAQNNRITYVQGRSGVTNGVLSAGAVSEDVTVRQLHAMVEEVKDLFFFDAASLAIQLNKTYPVNFSQGAGVYWTYRSPDPSSGNVVGTHIAWGDTPRVALPTSGSATYNFAGGTTPTDSLGRTGTLAAGRLGVDLGTRQVTALDPMGMSFARTSTAGAVAYVVPTGTSWALTPSNQTLSNVRCVGCTGSATGVINGRIVGTTGVGYAAGVSFQGTLRGTTTPHVASAALGFGRQ